MKFEAWQYAVTGAMSPYQHSDGDGGAPQTAYPVTGNHPAGAAYKDYTQANTCWLQIDNYVQNGIIYNSGTGDLIDDNIHRSVEFEEPPKLYTYEQMSNIRYNEESICVKSYTTATVANRRTYIGDVTVQYPDGTSKRFPDKVIKSMANKFDTFPVKYNSVEVGNDDGGDVIHLEEFADRLLIFKSDTLYIVNISDDIEFLEAKYDFKGVTKVRLSVRQIWVLPGLINLDAFYIQVINLWTFMIRKV